MIIIPDVHGRSFWKKAVEGHEEDRIIFLGDYLDPYPWEFMTNYSDHMDSIRRDTFENFKEIIEFKKSHPDNVTLLIGNHDAEYMYSTEVCRCRCDYHNYDEIQSLFRDNSKLFELVKCEKVNDKYFTFSHAGLTDWWTSCYSESDEPSEILNEIINDFEVSKNTYTGTKTEALLSAVGFSRGGWCETGSIVWSDVREWKSSDFGYQIFGHTQLEADPIVTNLWACLDVRRAFILTNEGIITELDGSTIPVKLLATSEKDTDS